MKTKFFIITLLFFIVSLSATSQTNFCSGATFFCLDTLHSYPASTNAGNAESGPNYGCLYSQPNPRWFYFRIANSGDMTIKITPVPGADIDFACWGPFSNQTAPCTSQLTASCAPPCCSDNPQGVCPYPQGNLIDCSYTASAFETCYIPNGVTDEYYILMITNYGNQPTNIVLSQTAGSASTNCDITVGINNLPESVMSIYPNPATNIITIENIEKATVEISTMSGQVITSINTVEKTTHIDIENLKKGIYIIKIRTEQGNSIQKFIKE